VMGFVWCLLNIHHRRQILAYWRRETMSRISWYDRVWSSLLVECLLPIWGHVESESVRFTDFRPASLPNQRDLLPPRSRSTSWRFLLRKHTIQTRHQINLTRCIRPSIMPGPNTMSTIENKEHRNADVRCEKLTHIPLLREKDVKAINQAQESKAPDDHPRAPFPNWGTVW
jgi:hypothetical protein